MPPFYCLAAISKNKFPNELILENFILFGVAKMET